MKILAINGSPKGKASNTNVMVSAFLKGAQEAGAETESTFLVDKKIEHCRGCHTCWSRGPGQCVISDDMVEVLSLMGRADVILFASPVYFENISGMLKVFMDRMTMIGGPQTRMEAVEDNKHQESTTAHCPKLMMMSSCGYPDRSEFLVTSLWINRVAQQMHMPLIAEIFATQGKFLADPPAELQSIIADYLQLVEKAGREVATDLKLSAATEQLLKQEFLPA